MAARYLTKSRFKLAMECPTKLFYTGKKDIYPDAKQEDEFLKALADGGFQVGELAKVMYKGGIEVIAKTHDEQLERTRQLLLLDEVTVFEGAICHGDLVVRVDVIRKKGDVLELIEVKAKSFDSTESQPFHGKRGGISSGMRPYLYDVAFQRHVVSMTYPRLKVRGFLMMADKSKICSVDGLNQRFKIIRIDDRPVTSVAPDTDEQSIGEHVLTCVNVDDLIDVLLREPVEVPGESGFVTELAGKWARQYKADQMPNPSIGSHCAKCEFRNTDMTPGLRSGLHDCWKQAVGVTEADFAAGTVLDLYNFGAKQRQRLIDERILRLSQINPVHLGGKDKVEGISLSQRQWMQASGKWAGGRDFYLDAAVMKREMESWTFPLHFIDFETARVAIPFFKGQRPYTNIAFQFSHHVMEMDGRVDHRSEFLCTTPGRKPNYDFVRALKAALGDSGTVFMWWPHEKTTLLAILDELTQDPDQPPDAAALTSFIQCLTAAKGDGAAVDVANRAIVDLCSLAAKAFFHPATKGSSSIKKVLPAVMQSSEFLKRRYSGPKYGSAGGIKSLNFPDQVWWQEVNGVAADPYKLLPPVFADVPREALEAFEADDGMEIAQGGAATAAYARLQFENMDPQERKSIEAALLRYCELDTLAMVMIYEAWRDWLN